MKQIVKQCLFLFCAAIMLPVTISYAILAFVFKKDDVMASFSQGLSLLPGKTGCFLRTGFYRFTLTRCHPNSRISFMTLMSQQDIELNEGIYIGPQCNIGRCSIGKDTLLGSGVHIMSGKKQHNFDDLDVPIRDQGGQFEKIQVGENCWIGNGALVMANVGDNSIVAAGSVVVSDLPPKSSENTSRKSLGLACLLDVLFKLNRVIFPAEIVHSKISINVWTL
jgi:acetyltransferase-like isoleucine patch superfamily enzyme